MQYQNSDDYACVACSIYGDIDMQDSLDNSTILLAEDDAGLLMCMPCYMKQKDKCLNCAKVADLQPHPNCYSEPWVCEECLDLPYTVHTASCYRDGCLTLDEFAEECFRCLDDKDKIGLPRN